MLLKRAQKFMEQTLSAMGINPKGPCLSRNLAMAPVLPDDNTATSLSGVNARLSSQQDKTKIKMIVPTQISNKKTPFEGDQTLLDRLMFSTFLCEINFFF